MLLKKGGKYPPGRKKFVSVFISAVPRAGGHAPAPLGVRPRPHMHAGKERRAPAPPITQSQLSPPSSSQAAQDCTRLP